MSEQSNSTDIYAKKDSLGLERYIRGLASYIRTCGTPTTIALQGGWGTGKTSLFYLVKEQIEASEKDSNEKCKFVELNTWQCEVVDSSENLTFTLIEQILKGLHGEDSANEGEHGSVYKRVKSILHRPAVATAKIAAEVVTGNGAVGDAAGSVINRFFGVDDGKTSSESDYTLAEQLKKDISSTIEEDDECSRLVVFIDDLDRLRPGKAVELLEGVKNFLDCEGCVFVLAIDQRVVFAGVREKFGPDEGKHLETLFFDKIIQVPFSLPVSNYNIDLYLKSLFTDNRNTTPYENALRLIRGEAPQEERAGQADQTEQLNNPRAIKRHVQMYRLYREILGWEQDQKSEVEACLFALIVLYSRMPKEYKRLIQAKRFSESDDSSDLQLPECMETWVTACNASACGDEWKTSLDATLVDLSSVLGDDEGDGISLTTLIKQLENKTGRKLPTTMNANTMLAEKGYIVKKGGDKYYQVTDKGRGIGIYSEMRPKGDGSGEYRAVLYPPRAYEEIESILIPK